MVMMRRMGSVVVMVMCRVVGVRQTRVGSKPDHVERTRGRLRINGIVVVVMMPVDMMVVVMCGLWTLVSSLQVRSSSAILIRLELVVSRSTAILLAAL